MKIWKAWFAAISLVSLAGCQPALMNIDVSELEQCPECKCECELPPVPPPIPEDVSISINNEKIDMNEGGRLLIEQYTYSREILHKLWQK